MNFTPTRLPYRQTGAFSKIALDYIDQLEELRPFFLSPPTLQGIQKAIEARKQFSTNRQTLVQHLWTQYEGIQAGEQVRNHIDSLLSPDTFTITAAHQNNIFTGPLYFLYKIVHAIKLAAHCKNLIPAYKFVPVFYMGTEDADLDELNHIYLGGEKITWQTRQTGAVGRMYVDQQLLQLIRKLEGQLTVLPHGAAIIRHLTACYQMGDTIQAATFRMLHTLFGEQGLVVLLPDAAALKKLMLPVFKDELLNQAASGIVQQTTSRLQAAGYKVQAQPREINLFYLQGNLRERIQDGAEFTIRNTDKKFSKDEMLKELEQYPERFSPNVILRGLYQETILPNVVFIGGGGETAYWLQLKELFQHYKVPFPVLVLRNSFLIVEKKWRDRIRKLGFDAIDFFQEEQELMNRLVRKSSLYDSSMPARLQEAEKFYDDLIRQTAKTDPSLSQHVQSLKAQAIQRLRELEKKTLRAGRRKMTDSQRQIHTIKEHLFPGAGLQERRESFLYYFSLWGADFLAGLYHSCQALEQEFVCIAEK